MVLLSRKEIELTNSCEWLPIHSIASLSAPIITIKYTNHINKLWLLFWLYMLNNFEEEGKSCRKKRHFTSCSSTKTRRHKHKPGMTAMRVSLYWMMREFLLNMTLKYKTRQSVYLGVVHFKLYNSDNLFKLWVWWSPETWLC